MIFKSDDNELDIPLYVSEISLKRYIAFRRLRQKWHDSLVEGGDNLAESLLDVLPSLIDGELSKLPLYVPRENVVMDEDFKGELSLFGLYAHLVTLIDTYQPSGDLNVQYEWFDVVGGEEVRTTFFIEPERAKRLFSEKSYTVGEYVELQEFTRLVQGNIEARAKDEGFDSDSDANDIEYSGDPKGNLAFALSKRKLAVLLRPEGEVFPASKLEREELIKRRMKAFDEIPLDIYFDVCFFLTDILKELPKTLLSDNSISPKNAHTWEATGKPSRKQKRPQKRKEGGFGKT